MLYVSADGNWEGGKSWSVAGAKARAEGRGKTWEVVDRASEMRQKAFQGR